MRLPAYAGMALIRAYQLTLSGLIGRQCRHLPSCSAYTSESIGRFGLWAGGWMGLARICRCNPWGTHGLDFPPSQPSARARWWAPWRYGRWRGVQDGVGQHGADTDRADMGRSGGEGKRSGFRCD
ncbi:membrane protein insertion efficiency factor YidD [Camelimonas sp. ID_303_24]